MNKECKRTYHFLCAKTTECLVVGSRFIIYCPEHRLTDATLEDLKEEEDEQETDPKLLAYYCSICLSGLDEDKIVICDHCDKAYHNNCHVPPVDINLVENTDWFC